MPPITAGPRDGVSMGLGPPYLMTLISDVGMNVPLCVCQQGGDTAGMWGTGGKAPSVARRQLRSAAAA